MSDLFLFPNASRPHAGVREWLDLQPGVRGELARHWFACMMDCGADVRAVLHDGHPTACVGEAAFAYVNVFTAHVNVGFFQGASLADPAGLLEGSGKRMRHVKLKPGAPLDVIALRALIVSAHDDMRKRLSEAV